MLNELKGLFLVILSSLVQTSAIVTLIVAVSGLMVYLYLKKQNEIRCGWKSPAKTK